jgi:NADP-dependent 3-hydroxy acid dehydrogenase YdfG
MNIALITGATSGMGRRMVLELNDRIPAIQEFWLIGRREDRLLQLER